MFTNIQRKRPNLNLAGPSTSPPKRQNNGQAREGNAGPPKHRIQERVLHHFKLQFNPKKMRHCKRPTWPQIRGTAPNTQPRSFSCAIHFSQTTHKGRGQKNDR
uniref:Uncharacterized protein n=1 Tax=Ditylenchus dipsaci TaxID=166011 RepID=A0A915E5R3_9BILA